MAGEGFKIGSGFVNITAKDSTKLGMSEAKATISKGTKEAGEEGGNNLGSGMRSKLVPHVAAIGATIAGAFAVSKIADFFGDSISEARESQKVNAQTAAVIKSTGGAAGLTAKQFGTLATAVSNKTGIDDEQIQAGENMLATFTNVRNAVGKGNDIFTQATKISTDLAVATGTTNVKANVLLGKALNDPIKGISALTRVGVTFSAGQKAQIANMVKHNNLAGAQKVILKELGKEFGGSAAAQATAGEKAKVAWKNLEEQIGTALLPVIDKLETFISAKLIPAMSTMFTWTQTHIIPALSAMAKYIGQNVGWLGPLVGGVLAVVAAVKIWSLAQAALNLVMEANPVILVTLAIAALVVGIVLAYQKVGWFRNAVNTAWSVIKSVTSALKTSFIASFDAVKSVINVVGSVVKWLWSSIVSPVFKAISAFVRANINLAIGSFKLFMSTINAVGTALKNAYNTVKTYVGNIVSFIGSLPSKARSALGSLSSAIGGVISSAFSHAVSTVRTDVGNVVSAVASLPGKVRGLAGSMASAGSHMMRALGDAIRNGVGDGIGALSGLDHDLSRALGLPHTFGGQSLGFGVSLPSFTIPGFATGGYFNGAGTGTSDSNLARISNGEYIMNAAATRKNLGLLNALNSGGSVGGGNNFYVTIDAKNVDDFAKVVQVFKDLPRQVQQTTGRRA